MLSGSQQPEIERVFRDSRKFSFNFPSIEIAKNLHENIDFDFQIVVKSHV
jgi:hypothetical protein